MKNFIISLLFFHTLIVFAQSNEIFGNSWYLESVHLNGTTYDNPDNHDSYSNTFFTQSTMITSICETGGIISDIIIDTDTSEIIFNDFTYYSGDCINGESIDFRETLFDFFEEISNPVNYTVTTDIYGLKSLAIENNGNVTVYKNVLNLPPEEILSSHWYLQYLVIDGNSYTPPINQELPYVELFFQENNLFKTYTCGQAAGLRGLSDFYFDSFHFFIYEMEQEAIDCEDPNNQVFQNLYFDFFWNNYLNEFTYTYESSGGEETFIIYDIEGNEAVYAKQPLSLDDISETAVLIYPNPSDGIITIANLNHDLLYYEVYDNKGQVVTKGDSSGSPITIDLSNNQDGIYFVKLQDTQSNNVMTKKIVIK